MRTGALFNFWSVNTTPTAVDLLLYMFAAILIACGIALGLIYIDAYLARIGKFSWSRKLPQTFKKRIVRGFSGAKSAVQRTRSMSIAVTAAVFAFTVLVPSPPMAAERVLTGTVAWQLLAGKDFQFQCADGLHGYGQFDRRGLAWAAYKSSANQEELERRVEATVRADGAELCFKLKDFDLIGEVCVPIAEKRSGIYRAGSKDDGCEIKVKERSLSAGINRK
jgi:hypothetical protein